MATGQDPPFPQSVIEMTTMPHEFKWLRINSKNEGNLSVDFLHDISYILISIDI
jgi:hypothetical protein